MVIDQRTEITVVLLSLGGGNKEEWVKFEGTVYAPKNATNATIRLFLRWEPDASIEWAQVAFEIVETPKPRKVRLAATNFRPTAESRQWITVKC